MIRHKTGKDNKVLALFDFDGTITKKDSFQDYLIYTIGIRRLFTGLYILVPILIAYFLKLMSNEKAKQKVLSFFFKGMSEKDFYATGNLYCLKKIESIIRQDAVQRIKWHKKQGHEVVIVTASLFCWLAGWCSTQGVELISTQMEVIDGYLSGRFSGKNCYGPEKVVRLKKSYDLESYYIYAYGDSRGDREMLELADEKYYKYFKG